MDALDGAAGSGSVMGSVFGGGSDEVGSGLEHRRLAVAPTGGVDSTLALASSHRNCSRPVEVTALRTCYTCEHRQRKEDEEQEEACGARRVVSKVQCEHAQAGSTHTYERIRARCVNVVNEPFSTLCSTRCHSKRQYEPPTRCSRHELSDALRSRVKRRAAAHCRSGQRPEAEVELSVDGRHRVDCDSIIPNPRYA
eukprot:1604820-Prymnesium_polylepis.1